jgi:hypothetical protein
MSLDPAGAGDGAHTVRAGAGHDSAAEGMWLRRRVSLLHRHAAGGVPARGLADDRMRTAGLPKG